MVDYIKSRNSPAPPRSAPWRRPARETEVSGLSLVYVGFLVSLSVWTQQSKGRFRLRLDSGGSRGGWTYVSERVQVVVGQLQLLEGDELPHPMGSGSGRVRVDVQPPGHRGLRLARHRPTTTALWRHRPITTAPWQQHRDVTDQQQQRDVTDLQQQHRDVTDLQQHYYDVTDLQQQHRDVTVVEQQHHDVRDLQPQHHNTSM